MDHANIFLVHGWSRCLHRKEGVILLLMVHSPILGNPVKSALGEVQTSSELMNMVFCINDVQNTVYHTWMYTVICMSVIYTVHYIQV